jgi:hypothetical protein
MPSNKTLDATLSLFRLAFLDREIWIGKKPDRSRLRPDKKPPMTMGISKLDSLANDCWEPLAYITDSDVELQVKAFEQLRNIMDLIAQQEEKGLIGYIIIDDISYRDNDFVFSVQILKTD